MEYVRGPLALLTVMACVTSVGLAVPALSAPKETETPRPSPGRAVSGVKPTKFRFATPPDDAGTNYRPHATRWPAASTAVVPVTATGKVAGTPVWARPAGSAYAGPAKADVQVLDQAAAQRAGVAGVLFKVTPRTGGSGRVRVGVDYAGFAEAYGANFGTRLDLVRLPDCVLTTPDVAACRDRTALPSANDAEARSVSAEVTFAGTSVVLAAAAGGGSVSSGGTYTATDLKPSGSWAGGGSSGSFTYSYPITVPPASGGLVPTVALSYDSGSVDGQTVSTQAQASWAGDGWGTPRSYIEQSFTSCDDDPGGTASPKKTNDLCYDGPILTLSLNGSSSRLVFDKGKNVWKPESDNGEVITRVANQAVPGDPGHWVVTARDGSKFHFGLNKLPGWDTQKPTTNSVDTVPVYSAHAGDPCYSSSGFDASVCTMGRRWNLDYVTDARGNAMSYYYKQDVNYYGRNQGKTMDSYVRDSYLDHIDYGFRAGGAYGTVPNKVAFGVGERCVSGTCQPLNDANKANWPDVPFDLVCAKDATCKSWSPSFFSTVRLTSITAKQYSASAGTHVAVDSYALTHTIPATGDGTSPTLWLASIARTGHDTSGGATAPITLPTVSFSGVKLPNRVRTTDGLPAFYRHRLQSITTETGSVITAGYELPEACGSTGTLDPATNTRSCYPVRWTPDGYTAEIVDWFNKYAVTRVTATDPTGGAPATATSYVYQGGAAWHYDDTETVKAKQRTYGQFRGYASVKTLTGDGVNDRRTQSVTSYYRGMSKNNNDAVVNVRDSLGGLHEDRDELAGSILETVNHQGENGPADNATINHYWVSAATATRARTSLAALTANWVAPALTLSRQRVTGANGTTWRNTETDYSYDTDVASPTVGVLRTSYSHTVPADPAYDRCTTNTYAPTSSASPLVGLIAQTETVAVACGGFSQGTPASVPAKLNGLSAPATVARPAQVVAHTRTFYDDTTWSATFPQPAAPTKGLVTMTQAAKDYVNGAYQYQTTGKATYDAYGRASEAWDGNNNRKKTAYTVNAAGLTTGATVTDVLGDDSSTTISPVRGLTLTTTDANKVVSTQQYDALGRVTAVWQNNRTTSSPANYKFSYVVSKTGVTATRTERANDANNYLATITLYDAMLRERQTQSVTPQGGRLVADNFYDTRGWVTASYNGWWDPATGPTVGAPVSARDLKRKVPNQTFTTYDGLGRAVIVENAEDNVTRSKTIAVANGDRTTVASAPGEGISDPVGDTVTTTATDAVGRTASLTEYKVRPQVTIPADTFTGTFTVSSPAAADVVTTRYGYDATGNQNRVTDTQGNEWTTTYNLLGQATSRTDPDAGTTKDMTYDGNGNLRSYTDARGKTVSFNYDALDRKTGSYASSVAQQSSANQLTSLVYDNADNAVAGMPYAKGHLTTAIAYSGGNAYKVQARGFTVFGGSTGETTSIPASEGALAGDYTVAHTHSTNSGLLLKDIYPARNGLPSETVLHHYDAFDTPDTLGGLAPYVQSVTQDAYGRVNQQALGTEPNQAFVTNTYDDHTSRLTRRLTTRKATTPAEVDQQDFKYDLSGKLIRQTSTRSAAGVGETQCYGYDELRRLTEAWTATDACAVTPTPGNRAMLGNTIGSGSAYWTSWAFDDLGNRVTQVQRAVSGTNDTTTTYKYNAKGAGKPHTLMSTTTAGAATGSTGYSYDEAGNTIGRTVPAGAQTLGWDDSGRLASVTTTKGTTSHVYDAAGELLLQKDPGTTTLYLGSQQFVLDKATNTITGTRYYALPGGGSVIRTGTGTNFSFALPDPHGTPTLYLDSTAQKPTWRQFTPYGENRGAGIAVPDNRGFLNKTVNSNIGLVHVGAREYDASVGRFISVDPVQDLSDPQQWNGYAYANNNPATYSDPSGLKPTCGPQFGEACPKGVGGPRVHIAPSTDPQPVNTSVGVTKRGTSYSTQEYEDGHIEDRVNGYKLPAGGQGAEWFARQIDDFCSKPAWARQCALANGSTIQTNMLAMLVCQTNSSDCDGLYGDALRTEFTRSYQKGRPLTAAEKEKAAQDVAMHGEVMLGILNSVGAGRGMVGGRGSSSSRWKGEGFKSCLNSFSAGTPVLMADGTTKPIAELKVGDKVLATDPQTGRTTAEEVTYVHVNLDTELADLTVQTADGHVAVLQTTRHHPVWSASREEWTDAGDLVAGETLTTAGPRARPTVSESRAFTGTETMYNLTVSNVHTYYVVAGQMPVLVHNDPAPVPRIIQNAIDAYNEGQLSQRMTGPKHAQVPDVFRGDTGPIGARRFWKDAKIYDVPGGGNDWRLLVKSDGTIGWVGPTGGVRGAGHNYDRITTYKPSC